MSGFTRVMKRVGCVRNGTSHDRVESLDEVKLNYITQPRALRYRDGHDIKNCPFRCRGKCKTLRNLPCKHGIELVFFMTIEMLVSPKGTQIGKGGSLEIFLKITYHR
jgi:hypothetical protein